MDRISSKDFVRDYGGLKNVGKLDGFVTPEKTTTSRQDKKGLFGFGKETVTKRSESEVRTKYIGKVLEEDLKEIKNATDAEKAQLLRITTRLQKTDTEPTKQAKARQDLYRKIILQCTPKKHVTYKEPIAEVIPRKTKVPKEGNLSRSREEEPVTTTKQKPKLPEKTEYTKSGYQRGPSASEKRIGRILEGSDAGSESEEYEPPKVQYTKSGYKAGPTAQEEEIERRLSGSSDTEEAPVIKPDVREILSEESRPRRERIAASLSKHLVMPDKIGEEELSRLMPRVSLNDPRYLDRAEKKIEVLKKLLEGFHTPTKLVIPKDEESRRKFVQTLFSPEFVDLDISFITSRIGLHQIQIDIK